MANFSKYMTPPGWPLRHETYYMAQTNTRPLRDPKSAMLNSGEPNRLTRYDGAGQSQARESSQIVMLPEQLPWYQRIFKPFGNIGNGAAQHRYPIRPDFVPLPARSNPYTRAINNPYNPYGGL